MLTKLLKYEYKTTARTLVPIGLGVLGLSLLSGLLSRLLEPVPDLPAALDWTQGLLAGANVGCTVDLTGADAENSLGGTFLVGGREHAVVKLRTNHRVADCRSDSTFKGVAGGEAVGEFSGLVYVAQDAQRTDAQQQSRNVLLSDTARITTMPQLEIYADDVKCSHGATVGQMDADAILYMRQRGLSEAQARRLQIEGFVGDIVRRCGVEPLGEAVLELAAEKLEKL